MSIFQSQNGLAKFAHVILSTTGATAIVTATNATGALTVEYVRLAEVAAATPTVILDIYDGSTAYKIRGTLAMAASTPSIDRDPIILEPGESLRATASAGNQVHVTALYTQQVFAQAR